MGMNIITSATNRLDEMSDDGTSAAPHALHPRLESLLAYWFVKCDGRRMPRRRDLPVEEWEPWHRNLALFEVMQYGSLRIFECRLSGSDLVGRFGREASGLSIDDLAGGVRTEVRANLERACATAAPVIVRAATGYTIHSELILPLCDRGFAVTALLLGSYPLDGARSKSDRP
jgi:hypothetical protein